MFQRNVGDWGLGKTVGGLGLISGSVLGSNEATAGQFLGLGLVGSGLGKVEGVVRSVVGVGERVFESALGLSWNWRCGGSGRNAFGESLATQH